MRIVKTKCLLLVDQNSALLLSDINTTTDEGRTTLLSARRLLTNLGRADAAVIRFADIQCPENFFKGSRFNGDGVITLLTAADDPIAVKAINAIMTTQGETLDRSGDPGVNRTAIEQFFDEARALVAWMDSGSTTDTLKELGDNTAQVFASVSAVSNKINDYFTRTRMAAFDNRATIAMNRSEDDYLALTQHQLTFDDAAIAALPLARIEPNQPLPLADNLNPAWAEAINTLRTVAIEPLFGEQTTLTEIQWHTLNQRLAAHAEWFKSRPDNHLSVLSDAQIRELVSNGAEATLRRLLEKDEALTEETAGLDAVVKLVRLNRDFVRLLHNFVSFSDFYSRRKTPIFQCGRLFLDSRECHLCIRVDTPDTHAVLATLSKCFLVYCHVTRSSSDRSMHILAVMSQGNNDYLMPGRNGLFIDHRGDDWDATVVKIVDAPISIRQAFFAPYKKFLRMLEEQMSKRAQEADEAASQSMAQHADKLAQVGKKEAAPPPPAGGKKIDLGTIALIGTAISGVAAVVGMLLQSFWGLGVYMPLGLLAIVLMISGPSMIIAAIKLHYRSLGPILDASGWAINGRVRIDMALGRTLTRLAKLPKGSKLRSGDPFQPGRRLSLWWLLLGIAMLAVTLALMHPDLLNQLTDIGTTPAPLDRVEN